MRRGRFVYTLHSHLLTRDTSGRGSMLGELGFVSFNTDVKFCSGV